MSETGAPEEEPEIKITPKMMEAGADIILGSVGGADLGESFCAPDLAAKVYRAMDALSDRR